MLDLCPLAHDQKDSRKKKGVCSVASSTVPYVETGARPSSMQVKTSRGTCKIIAKEKETFHMSSAHWAHATGDGSRWPSAGSLVEGMVFFGSVCCSLLASKFQRDLAVASIQTSKRASPIPAASPSALHKTVKLTWTDVRKGTSSRRACTEDK